MIDWPSGPSTIHNVGTSAGGPTPCRASLSHHQRDHDHRGERRQREHRVTGHEQGQPGDRRRGVRQQQRAGRGRDHRRAPPASASRRTRPPRWRGRRLRASTGTARVVNSPQRRADRPERPSRDRRPGARPEQVAAEQQRAGADGEHRHRRGAVEVRHDRVPDVAARRRGVAAPVHRASRRSARPAGRRRAATRRRPRYAGRGRPRGARWRRPRRCPCPSRRRTSSASRARRRRDGRRRVRASVKVTHTSMSPPGPAR